MRVRDTVSFSRALDHALTNYCHSTERIKEYIKEVLPAKPDEGELVPGFQGLEVRKVRIPLKEYKIGKRGGLKLYYLVKDDLIIPLYIYPKKKNYSEAEIKQKAYSLLKSILEELKNCN